MYRSLTFAIELALIEYFINELLLILIIWNEPFTIKYTYRITL
jgi:hypothetical protein